MSTNNTPAQVLELESLLRRESIKLTTPRPGECLLCYVYRMLEFGCFGRRWTERYRDLRAPRATALDRRLASRGACCCDCEICFNAYELRQRWKVWDETEYDWVEPQQMPPCTGVRQGSTQPCQIWIAVATHLDDADPTRWVFTVDDETDVRQRDHLALARHPKRSQAPTRPTPNLRHFYASGLIAAGCDVVTVQRALGHSTATTTLNTCSHLWPTAEDRTRKAASGLMQQALRAASSPVSHSEGRR